MASRSAGSELGDFLRARRERRDPADVGIRSLGTRRTPGLRREEVATLAGISADYYLRLEQGRDRHPSTQVLDAIARVLDLSRPEHDHLLALAGARARSPRRPRTEIAPESIRMLLTTLTVPAFVETRSFDIIAANALAVALSPGMAVGANRVRAVFLDDDERDMHPDWERAARGILAALRMSVGGDLDDGARALVEEMSAASDDFARLWAQQDVGPLARSRAQLRHPLVGELDLMREKLPLQEADGQVLVLYHAEPGSPSAERLGLLASLAQSAPVPSRAEPSPIDPVRGIQESPLDPVRGIQESSPARSPRASGGVRDS